MSPAGTLLSPGPSEASIVFVKPTSPCDHATYEVIVDERGHFVGNLAPGTRVALPVPPGPHTFYNWSSTLDQVRVEQLPAGYVAVGAERLVAIAGQVHHVALVVVPPCWQAYTRTRLVPPRSGLWDDLQGWLSSTRAVVADRAAGQAALDANPALLQTYIELGQRQMARRDAARAREERRQAIDAASQPVDAAPASP
jgi:hypothetical protein